MTKLQALRGSLEFQLENDYLYDKVLLDNGVTGSATYSGTESEQEEIDMCKADIYLELAAAPNMKDGSSSITWDSKRLMTARRNLYRKWGSNPPESLAKVIDGERIW